MIDVFRAYIEMITVMNLEPFIYLLGGAISLCSGYFLIKIYPLKLRLKERTWREQKRILECKNKINEESLSFLKESTLRQDAMLSGAINAMKSLELTNSMLNATLEKVSDKLSAHDERSVEMASTLKEIREHMPHKGDVSSIATSIADLRLKASSKEDILQILTAIRDLDLKLIRATEMLTEIKTRL